MCGHFEKPLTRLTDSVGDLGSGRLTTHCQFLLKIVDFATGTRIKERNILLSQPDSKGLKS